MTTHAEEKDPELPITSQEVPYTVIQVKSQKIWD